MPRVAHGDSLKFVAKVKAVPAPFKCRRMMCAQFASTGMTNDCGKAVAPCRTAPVLLDDDCFELQPVRALADSI